MRHFELVSTLAPVIARVFDALISDVFLLAGVGSCKNVVRGLVSSELSEGDEDSSGLAVGTTPDDCLDKTRDGDVVDVCGTEGGLDL